MRDIDRLLNWYRAGHRAYPWRETTDPYRIWMSEILLQQTRIAVVLQRYGMLLERFPTIRRLASARDSDFLSAWSGLGYYRRARNMLESARQIVRNHDGHFPSDLQQLLSLPGIGRYTAGAIRNVCFDLLTPSIDGNIGRVIARLSDCRKPTGSHSFRHRTEQFFMEFG
jgi:A/G-specific adenine glycosylase